ncbi:hypothetical protein SAMN04487969_12555 [Paenibacillus algorifonticola]|uniref:Uncharacterized protein n=1 Tax=Paenibacillus algorifonticola TaxID=684063 RepID=A0A1I2HPV2_9BACL|nr:hypothetical protein [Paenibacillus algorifonticola]SFF31849.1 hypothetical protein SAMN04487969_12555 [Paenibacillus algorifonticola]
MKNKLRDISIDGVDYKYTLSMRVENQTCLHELKIFLKESKIHPFQILIRTWDDPIIGCPLNSGFILANDKHSMPKEAYNLNHPKRVREWILYGLSCGWNGSKTIVIKDGLAAMQEMGYEIDRIQSSASEQT